MQHIKIAFTKNGRSLFHRTNLAAGVWLAMATVGLSQEGGLGSTATLEWLQKPAARTAPPSQSVASKALEDFIGSLTKEPVPAFRYRFWPARTDLKPGSAETHFYRALVQRYTVVQGLPKEQIEALNDLQSMDIQNIPPHAAQEWVDRFDFVYQELSGLADAEDLSWDLRFRDLRGKEIWSIRIEEVQQARNLSRLLQLKIATQIAKQDFAGATDSIRTGLRLAAFVGQGESIIQGLVGLSIENVMYSAIDTMIRSPDCPNMYWALQTLPSPIMPIRDAVETELAMVFRMFPVLQESDALSLSDKELSQRLAQSIGDLRLLISAEFGPLGAADSLGLMLSMSGADAKERLRAAGYDESILKNMTQLQASLIEAGRELRSRSDELLKGIKLRGPEGDFLRQRVQEDFDKWQNKRTISPAALIGSLLLPGAQNVHEAILRTEMIRNRLIAAEAIRLYAANHGGKVPDSLDGLVDPPVPLDPFTQKPFVYRVESSMDRQRVSLQSNGPQRFQALLEAVYSFPKVAP
ncbi:MAG: hypothetical protein WCI02_16240 [Planctomycetota bacterium]